MSHMQAVRRGVKADVKYRLAAVDKLSDFFFVCHLCDQSSRNKFFINSHILNPFGEIMYSE